MTSGLRSGFVLCFLFSSVLLSTVARAELNEAQSTTLRALATKLEPAIQTLTRDIHTYHWAALSKVLGTSTTPLAPQNDERARNYLSYLASLFWDPKSSGGGVGGSGLYVALDPVITSGYGPVNSPQSWFLAQILLPSGTRILDTRLAGQLTYRGPSSSASQEYQDAMTAFGCRYPSLSSVLTSPEIVSSNEQDFLKVAPCRALRDALFSELKVRVVRYPYEAQGFSMCRERPRYALILNGFDESRGLTLNRAVYFSSTLPGGPGAPNARDDYSENRLIIQKLFRLAGLSDLPWKELQTQEPATDVEKWASDNLSGCGKSHAEDW